MQRRPFLKHIPTEDFVNNLTPHKWDCTSICDDASLNALSKLIRCVRCNKEEDTIYIMTTTRRVIKLSLSFNGVVSTVSSKSGAYKPSDDVFKAWVKSDLRDKLRRNPLMAQHLVEAIRSNVACTFMVLAFWWFPMQPMTLESFFVVNMPK